MIAGEPQHPGAAGFIRTLRIVWLAMTLAVLAYAAVLQLVVSSGAAPSSAAWAERLRLPFAGSALALGLIAFFMRRHAFEIDVIQQRLDEGSALGAALESQQPNYLLLLGFHETIALLGFILGLIGDGLVEFLPYAIAATVLNLLAYPRLDALLAELQRRNPGRFTDSAV